MCVCVCISEYTKLVNICIQSMYKLCVFCSVIQLYCINIFCFHLFQLVRLEPC